MRRALIIPLLASLATPLVGQSVELVPITAPLQFDGIDLARDGRLYLSGSWQGQGVLSMAPDGQPEPVVDGLAGPTDSVMDSHGNLYVSEFLGTWIHRIATDGTSTRWARVPQGPAGMAIASDDTIYVTLYGEIPGTGQAIVRITPDGNVHPHVSGPELAAAVGLAVDDQDTLYVSGAGGRIFRVPAAGQLELLATLPMAAGQGFGGHLDWAGGLLFASSGIGALYAVGPDGVLHTVLSDGEQRTPLGPPVSPLLRGCNGLAAAPGGRILYLGTADPDGRRQLVRVDLDGAPPGTTPADAWAALQAGDRARAEVLFAAVLDQEAPPAGAHFGMGQLLHGRAEFEAAAEHFERAAADAAWTAPAAYNGACARSRSGQPDAAFADLQRALDAGFADHDHLRVDTDLADLHGDPRWRQLLTRLDDDG